MTRTKRYRSGKSSEQGRNVEPRKKQAKEKKLKERPHQTETSGLKLFKSRIRELASCGTPYRNVVVMLSVEFDQEFVELNKGIIQSVCDKKLKKGAKKKRDAIEEDPAQKEKKSKNKKRKMTNEAATRDMSTEELFVWLKPSAAEDERRTNTIGRLRELLCGDGQRETSSLTVVGSTAHKLVLPGGDVDVVLETSLPIRRLGKQIRQIGRQVTVLDKSRVPIVKYSDQKTGLAVDVSFANNSILLNKLVQGVLPHFAHLEALVVLVKYFVMGFEGLNDPARGGIGSYALFCLCVALLQREDREQPREGQRKDGEKEHSSSLSELLVKFFQLWGRDFNSLALGVCVREGGSLFAKSDRAAAPDFQSSLVIEDPLDGTNNIARATYRWDLIRQKFGDAFVALSSGEQSFAQLCAHTKMKRF